MSESRLTQVTFAFGAAMLAAAPHLAQASHTSPPSQVTVAGSMQSEAGCAGDWDPACAATDLVFDTQDQVWQGSFSLPAGNFEYKAALDHAWTENYGVNAASNGANISLTAAGGTVKFYYDHETHWVTDSTRGVAVAAGSFQRELGCPGDWQPDCLRSWLEDVDGDGVAELQLPPLAPGAYEVKVAINESWTENYGAGGAPGGSNISFNASGRCASLRLLYDASTHVLTVESTPAAPGGVCDDGLFCTRDDRCDNSGNCLGTGDPCSGGGECNNQCDEAADDCAVPLGTACGSATDNACTDPDYCDGQGICQTHNASPGTPCDNGLFCDGAELCNNGVCLSGGNPCGGGMCSEGTHRCAACGDGVVDDGEGCDDNNLLFNDGCTATCSTESGWQCSGTAPSVCTQPTTEDPDGPQIGSGEGCGCGAGRTAWQVVVLLGATLLVMVRARRRSLQVMSVLPRWYR